MQHTYRAGNPVLGLLAFATIGLLTTTLVLGLLGATGATTWTGTIGVVLLAAWSVAANHRRRRRISSRRRADARPSA